MGHRHLRRGEQAPWFRSALNDDALAEAVHEFTRGRWGAAQRLLNPRDVTGDVMIHRLQVLAQEGCRHDTIDRWITHRADESALLLQVYTDVARAFLDPADIQQVTVAWHQCVDASRGGNLFAQVALLTMVRCLPPRLRHPSGADPVIGGAWWRFAGNLAAQPESRRDEFTEGHRQYLQYYSPQWHGSAEQVLSTARELRRGATSGSPRHVLPLIAACEQLIASHLQAGSPQHRRGFRSPWRDRKVRQSVSEALVSWWDQRHGEHATSIREANYLAYALVHTGQLEAAVDVFDHIGPHLTPWPWGLDHENPAEAFQEHRERVRGEKALHTPPPPAAALPSPRHRQP